MNGIVWCPAQSSFNTLRRSARRNFIDHIAVGEVIAEFSYTRVAHALDVSGQLGSAHLQQSVKP